MPRTTMNIPTAMLDEIDAIAKQMFCSRSVAVRLLYGQVWSQSTSDCIKVNHLDITLHNPDHAPRARTRTRVRDVLHQRDLDLREEGPEQAISGLLSTLDWYGAKLAKGTTPIKFASKLLEAFPGADIGAELHKASAWLGESPRRRKKHLGSFLLSWMGRVGKGPVYKQPIPHSECQDYTKRTPEGDPNDF